MESGVVVCTSGFVASCGVMGALGLDSRVVVEHAESESRPASIHGNPILTIIKSF